MDLAFPDEVFDLCPLLISLLQSNLEDDVIRQSALATVQSLVHAFGRQHADFLRDLIPVVAERTTQSTSQLRGSALACMAAILREMGEAAIPYLPQVKHPDSRLLDSTLCTLVFSCHLGFS